MAGYEIALLRMIVAVTFLRSGVNTLKRRKSLGSASSYVRTVDVSRDVEERIEAATRARELDEALPSAAMGTTIGALALALAVPAAATSVSLGMLFALFAISLASTLTFAFLTLRIRRPKRYASLDVRDPIAVAPRYVWALAAGATATPLLWLRFDLLPAAISTVSSIAILVLARHVAATPALLRGDDLIAERFVDVRLREGRTAHLLVLAALVGTIFDVFSGQVFSDWATAMAALFGLLVSIALAYRLKDRGGEPPSEGERSVWSHAAI